MRQNRVVLRLALIALLLYALGVLTAARWELRQQQATARELESKKQTLLAQSRELEGRMRAAEEPESLRRLAWERLRMLRPGEKVFFFTDDPQPTD